GQGVAVASIAPAIRSPSSNDARHATRLSPSRLAANTSSQCESSYSFWKTHSVTKKLSASQPIVASPSQPASAATMIRRRQLPPRASIATSALLIQVFRESVPDPVAVEQILGHALADVRLLTRTAVAQRDEPAHPTFDAVLRVVGERHFGAQRAVIVRAGL